MVILRMVAVSLLVTSYSMLHLWKSFGDLVIKGWAPAYLNLQNPTVAAVYSINAVSFTVGLCMTLGASLLVSTIVWPPIDKLLFGPESVFNIFLRAIKARTDVQRMTDHHTGVPENNR